MKKCIILLFLLCFVFPQASAADSPIYSGGYWESAPSVAYNSEDGEFLVVWNVYNTDYPFDPKFFGPVMGQLIKENGSPIEEPFQIFSSGVLPKVAYNVTTKEYLVVAEQWLNTVGQRVSRLGKVIGGQTTLLTSARWPRVLYNSQSGKYLVTGARLAESPSGSGQRRIWIYTVQVGGDGRPEGPVSTPVYQNYSLGDCLEGAVYAIAYGPVTSVSYPNGKYLLAVKDARDLIILGSDGTYSTAASSYNDGSQIQDPFNVDATFGYLDGNPVFFLVWGETDSPFNGDDGQPWNGIWGGFIDAVTHTKVANNVFPISLIWAHHVDDANAMKWRPVTAYNGVADQFVVAWKETPSPHANNMTNKNHIRAGNRDSLTTSSGANVVVSSTSDTENPALPCIAPSNQTNKCLIAWEDHRNDFGDIYGSFINSTTLATSNLSTQVVPNDKQYWKKVSAGDWHSLGIRSDGTLWAWGRNCYGQLGLGAQTDRSRPTQVGNFTDWIDIAAGAGHSLGIRSNGTLWAWGWNGIGQLGLGDKNDRSSPNQVGSWTDWVDIAAGGSHSLGIRSNGTLWAWGWNYHGQLGLGDTTDRLSPDQVGSLTDWIDIAAGVHHSLGIRSNGTLWAWGWNIIGQLGLGDKNNRSSPNQVGSWTDWVDIAAGGSHSLGIRSNGTLWAWGYNGDGQLGLGDKNDRSSPNQVGSWTDWIDIAAGFDHSLGIRTDGTLWAWGWNYHGQLGLGDKTDKLSPEQVVILTDWVDITAGGSHSLGIRSNGTLWAWGYNVYGQLGLGNTEDRHEPTLVSFPILAMPWLYLLLLN